jgi:hypothetical protein
MVSSPEPTYETFAEFAAALEKRPVGMSPLSWVSSLANRKPVYSYWLLIWAGDQREEARA